MGAVAPASSDIAPAVPSATPAASAHATVAGRAHSADADDTPSGPQAPSSSWIPAQPVQAAVDVAPAQRGAATPAPSAALAEHVASVVGDLQVSGGLEGSRQVRMTLRHGDLDGVQILIGEEAGAMKIEFVCAGAVSAQVLQAQAQELTRKLSERMRRTVRVQVDSPVASDEPRRVAATGSFR